MHSTAFYYELAIIQALQGLCGTDQCQVQGGEEPVRTQCPEKYSNCNKNMIMEFTFSGPMF